MTQQHPNIIIRNALKTKFEKFSVSFNDEHWLQMENIIIAQPKSVAIKTPYLLLQVFYLLLLVATVACLVFCPQKTKQQILPIKYTGDVFIAKDKNKLSKTILKRITTIHKDTIAEETTPILKSKTIYKSVTKVDSASVISTGNSEE